MRLICPNCDAQYAIADDLIPAAGRDVQCSNCANTWFQTPGGLAEDTSEPEVVTQTPAPPFSGSIADAFREADEAPSTAQPTRDDDYDEDDIPLSPAPQPPANRKPMDASVADILREEAALESAQRKSEVPEQFEEQPELGMPDPTPPPARDVYDDTMAASAVATAGANRKELFPDIEEINSSLRSQSDRPEDATTAQEEVFIQKRRGFRTGFFGILLIIGILAIIYVYAPHIKDAVPAVAGAVDGFVGAIDQARIWLDNTVRNLVTSEG